MDPLYITGIKAYKISEAYCFSTIKGSIITKLIAKKQFLLQLCPGICVDVMDLKLVMRFQLQPISMHNA